MLEYIHEFYKMWDAHFTVPTFDFIFKIAIPEPNKGRLIIERDMSGRILRSVLC